MRTATLIRDLPGRNPNVEQRLWRLSEPLKAYGDGPAHSIVITSAANGASTLGEPETYIFPADEAGNVLSYGEMNGSFKGEMNHERALAYAGYEVR